MPEKEIKQTNFRIAQDTADAFRKFCEENGMNQAQGFDHIMQVVELDKAKSCIPERKTEIETFEKYTKDILAAYLYSIELNNNAEGRIREQFSSALDRKDKTIDDLRSKIANLQAEKEYAEKAKETAEKGLKNAIERENNAIEQMNAAKKNSADQEKINAMLTSQLATATDKLNGYDDLKTSETSLKKEVADLNYKLKESENAQSHIKELCETKLAEAEKALLHEKELCEQKLKDLQKASESELKFAVEKAIIAKEREMQEQIRQLDKKNAKLEAKIEQLQEQLKQQVQIQSETGTAIKEI